MDRQCSSCGGFCKKSGCERENVKPEKKKEWVGLTDEEVVGAANTVYEFGVIKQRHMNFARTIEAKLKEKNK